MFLREALDTGLSLACGRGGSNRRRLAGCLGLNVEESTIQKVHVMGESGRKVAGELTIDANAVMILDGICR